MDVFCQVFITRDRNIKLQSTPNDVCWQNEPLQPHFSLQLPNEIIVLNVFCFRTKIINLSQRGLVKNVNIIVCPSSN